MVIKRLLVGLATFGPIGYVPASGTVATLVTLGIYSMFYGLYSISTLAWLVILICLFLCSLIICSYAIAHFKSPDPRQIVIDEALGSLVTFFGIPPQMPYLLVGFLLFRFFDISKPCGISKIDGCNTAWSVMLDDVAAGVLSNIILRIMFGYW